MKLLIPTRKHRFRLVNDLQQTATEALPAGTVIGVDALKVNRYTKGTSHVRFLVYASPDPSIAMKKHGGTHDYGLTFGLTFDQASQLEVELVEDMP
jgi:hypothetical protein